MFCSAFAQRARYGGFSWTRRGLHKKWPVPRQLGGNRPWGMREKKTSLEGDLAVIHRRGGFGGRRGVAVHRRRAVAVRLVEKLDPAAGD